LVETICAPLDVETSLTWPLAVVHAFPERLAAPQMDQDNDDRQVALVPVGDVLGVHQILERLAVVGGVAAIVRGLDLDRDQPPGRRAGLGIAQLEKTVIASLGRAVGAVEEAHGIGAL